MASGNEQAIEEFINITGLPISVAEQYLARNEYDVTLAVNDFYNNENVTPGTKSSTKSSSKPSNVNRGFGSGSGPTVRSFSDLQRGNVQEDSNDDDDMNFFTGGEKSGLAVENPNKYKKGRKLVDDLIEQAQKDAEKPDWRDDGNEDNKEKKTKLFKGTGHSLGSVENAIDSRTIKDPSASNSGFPHNQEKIERTITFWKEGFSVDDGELYKYDDPQNQEYLKQLNQGRAPLSLLKVEMFQPVDVKVDKRLEESYHDNQKSKPRVYGFEGIGQRLGSPIPGEPTTVEEAMEYFGAKTESPSISVPVAEKPKEQESKGDTKIQIRLGDGSRIVQNMNSTDKVEEIYNIIRSKTNDTRSWTVATTFPTQLLDDKKNQTIAEAGLKNAVVVQKWI